MKRWMYILLTLISVLSFGRWLIIQDLWPLTPDERLHVTLTPIYVVFVIGIYAVVSVLQKVFTFNECHSAYIELREDIKMAKEDLDKKGFYNM